MSRRFTTPIDLQKNELQNPRIQNLAADPTGAVSGQIYYNTVQNELRYFDGTVWKPVGGVYTPASSVTSETTYGIVPAVGTSLNYARQDHTHGSPPTPTASSVGAVANNGGAPGLQVGTSAARPTSGQITGNIYVDNDDYQLHIATSATTFAQLLPFGASPPVAVGSAVASVGTATSYVRSDHVHGVTTAAPTASAVGDASVTGTALTVSLSDHKHPREGFGAVTAQTAYGATSTNGTQTTVARSDHAHGTPPVPSATQVGAVANNGNAPYLQTGTAASRPATGLTVGGIYVNNDDFLAYLATSTTAYSQIAPFALAAAITAVSIAGATAAGTANTYARGDHAHAGPGFAAPNPSAVADTQGAGSASTVSRSDHVHAREGFGNVTATTTFGATANNGTQVTVARSDHSHGTPAAPTATSVGAVANAGAAPSLQTGTAAGLPASGQTIGAVYIANDSGLLFIATSATTFSQLAPFGLAAAIQAVSGSTTGAGTANTYARSDHQHGLGTAVVASTSAVGATAAAGTSATAARADHVHGRESFGVVTAQTTFGAASGNGTQVTPARSDHVHGTPTHDAAAHSAVPLSALAAATANINLGGFRATNAGTPTAATDLVTKAYADNLRSGISLKDPVRVATTVNVALTGTQTIDGVALVAGDRVLVKNQTTTSENGIWVVAAGAWARGAYADQTGELVDGSAVWVQTGTANGDQRWVLTSATANPWVPGTTGTTWTLDFAATSVTAGAGLSATGSSLNVGQGTGISVGADDVSIDTAVVVRKSAQAFGDGAATSFVITHNLNTQDVTVAVYTNSGSYDEVECDIEHTSANTITLRMSVAPTLNQYRVVVHG